MPIETRLVNELRQVCEQLSQAGKLASRDQLAAYYDTFRERFGAEKLASLTGETLLEAMHEHSNSDSLVYWLEFKNDEEFPTHLFGGIGGGNALKFGIYRRKETGEWMTGTAKKQRTITTDEAVGYARKHRDQLLKAVELVDALPEYGTDDDYLSLQASLDVEAPDLVKLAWTHKYLSMLFPRKVDDFHSAQFAHFNLIKLLQLPPDGDGRYLWGGRLVALARELDIPVNWLTFAMNHRHGRPHRYWRVGTTSGKTKEDLWPFMRDENCVAVGWTKLGDLSWLEPTAKSKQQLKELIEKEYPNAPSKVGQDVSQVFGFIHHMSEGDLIVASRGHTALAIGRLLDTGYEYVPSTMFPHCRRVQWLDVGEWPIPEPEIRRTTFYEFRKHPINRVEIEKRLLGASPSLPPIELRGIPGRIQSILERKKQVILYGPPGTGKTHWAQTAARELAAQHRFHRRFEELAPEQQGQILGTPAQPHGNVRVCCFHPAYGYEDFMEGYRPHREKGQLSFELRDGIFKQLCLDAQAAPHQRFYLIVDEINRGDIPRIFGELLMVMEADKRGQSILLPVSGEAFSVPPNVCLIGTMNTADRSIALLDTALRRRFGFVELMPDVAVLGDAVIEGIPLGPWLDALNQRICTHVGADARNLQVGHAYLLNGGRPVHDMAAFTKILREDIVPLLEEYCYEDYAALESILGKGLVDAQRQLIRHEMFERSARDALVTALLAPCADLVTSTQAVASEDDQAEEDESGDENGPADEEGDEQ